MRRAVPGDVVDGHDVGVVERRGGTRLLLEPARAVGVGRESGCQQLERHLAPQPPVFGEVNLAHPASAYLPHDAEPALYEVTRLPLRARLVHTPPPWLSHTDLFSLPDVA